MKFTSFKNLESGSQNRILGSRAKLSSNKFSKSDFEEHEISRTERVKKGYVIFWYNRAQDIRPIYIFIHLVYCCISLNKMLQPKPSSSVFELILSVISVLAGLGSFLLDLEEKEKTTNLILGLSFSTGFLINLILSHDNKFAISLQNLLLLTFNLMITVLFFESTPIKNFLTVVLVISHAICVHMGSKYAWDEAIKLALKALIKRFPFYIMLSILLYMTLIAFTRMKRE